MIDKKLRKKLIELSCHNTIALLYQYGNHPTAEHTKAIKKIIKGFVHLLDHKAKLAYPLFCGGGKSTCIRGFLKGLHTLNLDYSIVVSANQVEALCELKRALRSDGIPPDMIGLIHSKPSASIESDTPEQVRQKPFVLVTHNKIKHEGTLDAYFYYQDKQRDLVIWDESLLAGESSSISAKIVRELIASTRISFEYKNLKPGEKEQYYPLLSFLDAINNSLKEAQVSEERDFQITFEEKPHDISKVKDQINYLLDNKGEELCLLVDCIYNLDHIRYIKEQNGSLIYFEQTLPPELESIAILDASHQLRELTKSDPSIKMVNLNCSKSYEKLRINYFKGISGRESLENEFRDRKYSNLVKELIGIVCSILEQHPEEPLALWTFKEDNGINIIECIKDELAFIYPGINFERVNSEGKKIFNFMTFGNELGLNSLTHCKHSIFCGVLWQPPAPLAMSLKGLAGNMERDVYQNNLLYQTQIAEQAHVLYQAISRGSSRETVEGNCSEHSVYFSHHQIQQVRELLKEVFPKARWRRYNTQYLANPVSLAYQRGSEVEETLSSLPEEKFKALCGINSKSFNRISTRKARALFPHYKENEWKQMIREFNRNEFPEWKIDGRSFKRREMIH